MAQTVKNPPAMQETRVRSLNWEDPLEESTATHSSILAWRIPGMGKPGGLPSMGWHRVGHDWSDLAPAAAADCSPPGSSVHGDSSGKDTGVGCHALLQGIFPIQGSNPGLPHCRRILYTHPTHPPEPLGKPCYNMLDLVYMASIFVTFSWILFLPLFF